MTAALALLADSLIYLEALGIDVEMVAEAGTWTLAIGPDVLTTGEIVARAVALGMMGRGTVQ